MMNNKSNFSKALFGISLALLLNGFLMMLNAQTITHSAGITYGTGAPTHTAVGRSSKVYFDVTNVKLYDYNGTTWELRGDDIDRISGCTAPNYIPGLGDSHLAINGCTSPDKPQLYAFVGPLASNWVMIAGFNGGEGITVAGDSISLSILDRIRFNAAPVLAGGERVMRWNNDDGTFEFGMKGGAVTQQIGQEAPFLVRHADNTALQNGKVVYLVGSTGSKKTVRYAQANSEATSSTTFGLMTESGSANQEAFCNTFGYVRGLNTSNLTEGDIVWLSKDTAGAMTAVRPQAPNHSVQIGLCVRKHVNDGIIFVQIQNGYELEELHDVYLTNKLNRQVIAYDSLDRRWENTNLSNLLGSAIGSVLGVDSITTMDKQIAYGKGTSNLTGANNLVWDYTNNKMGINVSNPQYTIHASGPTFRFENNDPLNIDVYNTTPPAGFPKWAALGVSDLVGYVGTFSDDDLYIITNAQQRMVINQFGRVGIGTPSGPAISATLEVQSTNGGILFPRMTTSQRDNINLPNDGLVIYNTSTNKLQVRANGLWVDLH
jgi:hypothetical protein